jgi:hypothetical protein
MPRCRIIAAVVVLAFAVGPAVAQVASTAPEQTKPPAVVETTPDVTPVPPPPVSVSPVPEPGSVALLGGAAVGWVVYWRRKWRAPQSPQA